MSSKTPHKAPREGSYRAPVVDRFPVCIPPGFAPSDADADGVDRNWKGKPCPGYEPPFAPASGGGYTADRHGLAHRAWDIMAAEGAPVVAPARCIVPATTVLVAGEGPVPGAGWRPKGGNYCVLLDEVGTDWYLAHMIRLAVEPGAELAPGELVGWVGREGNASYRAGGRRVGCPHLHIRGKDHRGHHFPPERHLEPLLRAGAWAWCEGWPLPAILNLEA